MCAYIKYNIKLIKSLTLVFFIYFYEFNLILVSLLIVENDSNICAIWLSYLDNYLGYITLYIIYWYNWIF